MIEDEEPMKKCSICGELKPFSEFYKHPNGKYGVGVWCKDCTKEYYENNKERTQEYGKKWREKNKDRKKIYDKEYRENVNNYKRQKIGLSLRKHTKKGFDVLVTLDECMKMDNNYCFYCGCRLEWAQGTGFSNCSPTIDRLNNENILTKNNIVFACHACNAGKSNGTVEEYIERCKRVVANENNILRK